MPRRHSTKERITVSLNKATAAFLRRQLATQAQGSFSALVESIIAREKRQVELQHLSAQVTAYYDSLPEGERREDAAWGELGETELAHTGL
jgi:hypothetical protein